MSNDSSTPREIEHRCAWALVARAMNDFMRRRFEGASIEEMTLLRLVLITELRALLALCREMDASTRRDSHYTRAALGMLPACGLSEDDLNSTAEMR